MIKTLKPVEILSEEKVKSAPKNVGPLPTAQADARRLEHSGRSTLNKEEIKQSTEAIVDHVLDSRLEGRCRL